LAALAIACLVGWWVARRGGASPESALFNLFLIGLVCARLGFVAAYWPMYRDEPLQTIDIRDGGFLLWPGLAGLVLGALWQGWRQPDLRRSLG
ncbi:prolipoprotein diacylglyceryl transferase, partial [Klebsiella pneumoniae]|nr:prolipoprotein diacylglyceryl transferase [Klebsiella pneumoniae]